MVNKYSRIISACEWERWKKQAQGDRDALAGPDREGSRDTITAEYVLPVG